MSTLRKLMNKVGITADDVTLECLDMHNEVLQNELLSIKNACRNCALLIDMGEVDVAVTALKKIGGSNG